MSPATHCLPNGVLGLDELPVPNISGQTVTTFLPPAGPGNYRGVIVYYHGLYPAAVQFPIPPSITDVYGAFGSAMVATLCTNLAYDGWIVICPPAQEDTSAIIPPGSVYLDAQNDSGYGARYLASTLHTWDHIYEYIQQTYGNWPVVVGGSSIGGTAALEVVAGRAGQLVGYFASIPLTIFETLVPSYTPGYTYADLNWSGIDLGPTLLNAITVPGAIQYATADNAVWWGGDSTLATVNGGTSGIAAASVTACTVSGGSTNFENASGAYVTLTGLTAGTSQGRATYTYTGFSAGAFTGMSLVSGSGSVVVGVTVVQSTADSMLTNALGASQPVTRISSGETHSFSITDSGAYYAGAATTISALNTLTTLQITPTQASCQGIAAQALISTKCAIQDTGGAWHVVTFSGVSTPNLTGVSIAGSGSIAANAPIMNTGTAITGGFSNQSIPYWVNQVLDPSYPATL